MATPRSRRYLGEVVSRRYMVDRLIGEGSFAWVYHARARNGEEVAVKILHSAQATAAVRFAREINVLKSLPPNPYVAQHIDHGETRDGAPLLVLEFVDGITLKLGLERRPKLAPEKAVAFLAELCQAFAGLHQLGVAHRDVKPENILLARRGGIKLIDFGLIRDAQGILKLLEEGDPIDSRVFSEDLDRGVLAGTPEYMAPEQFSDSAVEDETDTKTDTHSDVFSLGVILWELLMGEKPFPMKEVPPKDYAKELLRYLRGRIRLRDEDIPPIPGIDGALASIVRKALRRDPKRRQPDSRVLMDDLLRYLETGEGAKDVDESRTQIVAFDSVMAAMRPAARREPTFGSVETRLAEPPPASAPAEEFSEEDSEESTTGPSPLRARGIGGPEPAGRGHSAPFFDMRDGASAPRPDPLVATVKLDAPPLLEEGVVTAAVIEDSGVRQDVVPTQLLEDESLWPVENLADPPQRGEPEVFSAPTDAPSLGEEDLFELGEADDDLQGFDGFIEGDIDPENPEVNLAELMPDEPSDDRRRR
jgi:serine/threonine protein kinase